ncbi:MAG: triose-phosphate isomerase [bacterium]|nr:triose-phosphate isomerase [bacterium]
MTQKKPLIAANWKMNHVVDEALKFLTEMKCSLVTQEENATIVICPSYTALYAMGVALQDDNTINLGAQNCHFEDSGAFTGEVSTDFLKEVGCDYVIIGHSERRHIFGETDEMINKKLHKVFEKGMIPIFCVGETEQEREEGKTFTVIENQLKQGLKGLLKDQIAAMAIAYEPVWAIGTGKTASPEQAQEVHNFIRKEIAKNFGTSYAADSHILYGGSVKPSNIKDLMVMEDIDGALIGGASLKSKDFLEIISNCN